MIYKLRIKVFSKCGIFEGIFDAKRSTEYIISIDVGGVVNWSMPWDFVQSATFFPEEMIEKTQPPTEMPLQIALFTASQ